MELRYTDTAWYGVFVTIILRSAVETIDPVIELLV